MSNLLQVATLNRLGVTERVVPERWADTTPRWKPWCVVLNGNTRMGGYTIDVANRDLIPYPDTTQKEGEGPMAWRWPKFKSHQCWILRKRRSHQKLKVWFTDNQGPPSTFWIETGRIAKIERPSGDFTFQANQLLTANFEVTWLVMKTIKDMYHSFFS